MFWHPHGDYLAVKVDRYTKTRKTTYTSFELFSVKGRDIPMEVLPGSGLNSVCLLSLIMNGVTRSLTSRASSSCSSRKLDTDTKTQRKEPMAHCLPVDRGEA